MMLIVVCPHCGHAITDAQTLMLFQAIDVRCPACGGKIPRANSAKKTITAAVTDEIIEAQPLDENEACSFEDDAITQEKIRKGLTLHD